MFNFQRLRDSFSLICLAALISTPTLWLVSYPMNYIFYLIEVLLIFFFTKNFSSSSMVKISYGNYTTLIELLPLTVARMSDKKLGGFGRFFAFSLGFYRAVHQARAKKQGNLSSSEERDCSKNRWCTRCTENTTPLKSLQSLQKPILSVEFFASHARVLQRSDAIWLRSGRFKAF